MSEVTINNSPFHTTAQITYPYGEISSGYSCGFHTGLDLVSRTADKWIYSIGSGVVISASNNPNQALGCNVLVQNNDGKYCRYCHMVLNSIQVRKGQIVDTNTALGIMGSTGNVTGPHLHLEVGTTQYWVCSTFINPADYLGIPNIDDTIVNYDGEITPEPPNPPEPPEPPEYKEKKHKFPWILIYKKRRNNN